MSNTDATETSEAGELMGITKFVADDSSPTVTVPKYDRSALRMGMAHIGVGNFHRVHQATYLDDLLHLRADQSEWGILGVELLDDALARTRARAFLGQDKFYSFTAFSPAGERVSRVNGSMVDYLHAPRDPAVVVRALSDSAIRVVTMTITEGAYNLDEETGEFDLSAPDVAADLVASHPHTTFGILTAALRARRGAGVDPFTVVSCDNLRSNGHTARTATVGFAAATDPAFARWIEGNVAFPNSMVDRIAPTVDAAVRVWLNGITGIADGAPVTSESFKQWVLEDMFPGGRPAWEEVGVELRGDVAAFEAIKGRLINASHMLMSYPAALLGYERVSEAASDPFIAELLEYFMAVDAAPLVAAPSDVSLEHYRKQIVPRFANPNVPDTVLRVAHDGAAKLPIFHRATAEGLIALGRDVRREALLLAAFRRYVGGVDEKGASFKVEEPHLHKEDWPLLRSADPLEALKASPFAAWGLDRSADFVSAYTSAVRALASDGVHAAIRQALGK
jgi:mannitol-1-phosphate/altronate dehydrogenase